MCEAYVVAVPILWIFVQLCDGVCRCEEQRSTTLSRHTAASLGLRQRKRERVCEQEKQKECVCDRQIANVICCVRPPVDCVCVIGADRIIYQERPLIGCECGSLMNVSERVCFLLERVWLGKTAGNTPAEWKCSSN